MRFAFTPEQLELRQAVRQVLDSECTPTDVREVFGPPGESVSERRLTRSRRWSVLAELGAVGLLGPSPEGLGLGEVELVGLLEEAGWAALPEPLAESAGLAVPLLTQALMGLGTSTEEAGARDVLGKSLTGLCSGELIGSVGGLELSSAGWSITTFTDGQGMAHTPRVPAGRVADVLVLPSSGAGGATIHLVGADACSRTPEPTLDPTRELAQIAWRPSTSTLLADGELAQRLIDGVIDRGGLVTSAALLGLADRLLEMSASYTKERRQFGKPIGTFQAIKHLLANVRVRLEFTRPAVYRAAWSVANDVATRAHDVSVAKALASDTADLAASTAIQVHGAIGYTWECDVQLWAKRVWALSVAWGKARDHRSMVLRHLIERGSPPLRDWD